MAFAKVIEFHTTHKQHKVKKQAEFPYFTEQQIKLLRRTVKNAATLSKQKNQLTAVREWMLIDLLTSSGIREAEAVDLRCGDIKTGYGQSAIFIRNGKGSKSRTVQIPASLRTHLKAFMHWKADRGEPTGFDDYVFIGQRGHITTAAVQQCVKKWLKKLNLYEPGKSAHSLRHSYAVALYRKKHDIRAVQKQLGHSNIQTTQIYADVLSDDIQNQLTGLWN